MTTKKTETGEIELNGIKYVPKSSVKTTNNTPSLKGMKLCIIRSYGSGVHYGYVGKREDLLSGLKVTMHNTRRIWYWDGACSLSQLALDGVKKENVGNCKFSVEIPELEVTQVIEVIPVSEVAAESINSVPVWKK